MARKPPPTIAADRVPVPPHLGEAGAQLFAGIAAEYGIDDVAGRALLEVAAVAADRLATARAALAKDGEFVATAAGAIRPHPALQLERTSREGMLSALRALHLDVAPKLPPGRPVVPTSVTWDG